MAENVTFEVVGNQKIHCAGCEQAVQQSLSRLAGVRQVKADHRTQRVVVRLEPAQTSVEAIRAKLANAGYETRPDEGQPQA